jgi:hypothetical protein
MNDKTTNAIEATVADLLRRERIRQYLNTHRGHQCETWADTLEVVKALDPRDLPRLEWVNGGATP